MNPALHFAVLLFTAWVGRQQQKVIDYLLEENRILRERLGPKPIPLTRKERIRLAVKGHKLGRARLSDLASIAKADTILRWYRNLVTPGARKPKKKGRGRPKTDAKVAQLVVRMARENSGWGYSRIKDSLANVGIRIGRNTVARILAEHGIEPAPKRKLSWRVFLTAHWSCFCSRRNQRRILTSQAQVQDTAIPLPLPDVKDCSSPMDLRVARFVSAETNANDDSAAMKRRFAVASSIRHVDRGRHRGPHPNLRSGRQMRQPSAIHMPKP